MNNHKGVKETTGGKKII